MGEMAEYYEDLERLQDFEDDSILRHSRKRKYMKRMEQYDEDVYKDDNKPSSRKVVLYEIRQTDKAILFSTGPIMEPNTKEIWLPRSRINHISRGPEVANDYRRCVVDCEEWLLKKYNL